MQSTHFAFNSNGILTSLMYYNIHEQNNSIGISSLMQEDHHRIDLQGHSLIDISNGVHLWSTLHIPVILLSNPSRKSNAILITLLNSRHIQMPNALTAFIRSLSSILHLVYLSFKAHLPQYPFPIAFPLTGQAINGCLSAKLKTCHNCKDSMNHCRDYASYSINNFSQSSQCAVLYINQ